MTTLSLHEGVSKKYCFESRSSLFLGVRGVGRKLVTTLHAHVCMLSGCTCRDEEAKHADHKPASARAAVNLGLTAVNRCCIQVVFPSKSPNVHPPPLLALVCAAVLSSMLASLQLCLFLPVESCQRQSFRDSAVVKCLGRVEKQQLCTALHRHFQAPAQSVGWT